MAHQERVVALLRQPNSMIAEGFAFMEAQFVALHEDIYVAQPKGFEDPVHPNHVYKLRKAFYGLKQAPRVWYEQLTQYLLHHGYDRGSVDKRLLVKTTRNHVTIAQIYADDIVFGSTLQKYTDDLVEVMNKEFEMSIVGQMTYFLGLQVKQSSEGYFISQKKYAKNLVKKFELESSKTPRTLISTSTKLSKDDAGPPIDSTVYRSLIGSLLYLTASRPDIMFSFGMCARHQSAPKKSHLIAAKRILKYVRGTIKYGIWYSKESELSVTGYCDADWAGNIDDRKSTSGGCFFVGKELSIMAEQETKLNFSEHS
ncbi:PREDICTED: uncharacterized protein LOC109153775 [Ipomoea nil]|uniref:uncharacterized protein LOC109153775 n=1 Tax=Ipomoea nil TaxID=35883 RepID=UPI000901D2CE|nr:PREDICTED: uncharacterized protein LOC109153775 [Ipomoea nil]